MDERRAAEPPPDEAVFAPARIARRPAPIAALSVALALGALALAGVLDGLRAPAPAAEEKPVETAAPHPTSTSPPLIGRGWPPAHLASEAPVPVRIDSPAGGAGAVTDRFIAVRGELRVHAAAVRVSLQTSERVTLDSTVVDTSNVDGGIRPLHAPAIDVQLALPTPRPTGERLWIVVTAYDGAGTPVGAVRRLVTIAEIADG